MRFWELSAAAFVVLSSSLVAQNPVPLGTEFQINTYTTSYQRIPSAAFDAQGNFVVVWDSNGSSGTDTDGFSIQAQRYSSDGQPVGGQFQVNSYTTGFQTANIPSLAGDALGNFVVVWTSGGSYSTDSSYNSVQAQRYDKNGQPLGGEFQVNTYTTYSQSSPSVALDSQGNFVVTWTSQGSNGSDTDGQSIQARRYDADGVPLGGEFQVNTYTTYSQRFPSVSMAAQGSFVVVWDSQGSDGPDTGESIQAQRYDPSGAPVGGEFQVNSFTTGRQVYPSVSMAAQGSFVVVWDNWGGSSGSDSDGQSAQARRFAADGAPIGGDFQVNSSTTGNQANSNVAVGAQGNFVVTWDSYSSFGTDTSGASVQVQYYDAMGQPVGQQFQVNSYTTGYQWGSSVAIGPLGNFVVTWHSDSGSYGTDSDSLSAQGQRFASPLLILASGFESGDTTAWSNTVP